MLLSLLKKCLTNKGKRENILTLDRVYKITEQVKGRKYCTYEVIKLRKDT